MATLLPKSADIGFINSSIFCPPFVYPRGNSPAQLARKQKQKQQKSAGKSLIYINAETRTAFSFLLSFEEILLCENLFSD